MREARIVTQIMAAVRREWSGAYVRKLADRLTRGLPDLVIVVQGVVLFVEVKNETGRSSRLQEKEGQEINKAGGIYLVAKSPDAVLAEIKSRITAVTQVIQCGASFVTG